MVDGSLLLPGGAERESCVLDDGLKMNKCPC